MAAKKEIPDFKGIFGLVEAEIEKAVLKPSIYRYEPYIDQLEFHKSAAPGKYVSGGNRAGKTTSVVVEAIWWATDSHPFRDRPEAWGHGAIQQRFVAVDIAKGVEQILLPAFKRWVPREYLINGSWGESWDKGSMTLTFSNGSTIDFLTYNMDLERHGGVPRHIIYFDEEPPRPVFNEGLMRLMDYDGWWVISATPVKGMTWTYDLLWEPALEAKEAGEPFPVSIHQLDPANNPYLQAEDKSRFYIAMDKEEQEMRSTGKFVARSGLVFPEFSPHTHVVPAMTDPPPKHWTWYASVDHGLNNPTAWLWHAVAPDGTIITFDEHYASNMTVEEHASVVSQKNAMHGKLPERYVGDPAMKQRNGVTGTSILQEYAFRGIPIIVDGVPHAVSIGLEKMRQYFQVRRFPDGRHRPTWVITENCFNLIRELKKLRYAAYDSSKKNYDVNRKEEVHKKDDHAFDSARYFATLLPDLRVDLLKPQPLAPGERGSLSDVYAAIHQWKEREGTMYSPAQPVEWTTTDYFDA